jgi:hypothetical protein
MHVYFTNLFFLFPHHACDGAEDICVVLVPGRNGQHRLYFFFFFFLGFTGDDGPQGVRWRMGFVSLCKKSITPDRVVRDDSDQMKRIVRA